MEIGSAHGLNRIIGDFRSFGKSYFQANHSAWLFLLIRVHRLSCLISSDGLFQWKRTRKVNDLPTFLHKHWAAADIILFGTSFKVTSSLVINYPAIAFLDCRIRQNHDFYKALRTPLAAGIRSGSATSVGTSLATAFGRTVKTRV